MQNPLTTILWGKKIPFCVLHSKKLILVKLISTEVFYFWPLDIFVLHISGWEGKVQVLIVMSKAVMNQQKIRRTTLQMQLNLRSHHCCQILQYFKVSYKVKPQKYRIRRMLFKAPVNDLNEMCQFLSVSECNGNDMSLTLNSKPHVGIVRETVDRQLRESNEWDFIKIT